MCSAKRQNNGKSPGTSDRVRTLPFSFLIRIRRRAKTGRVSRMVSDHCSTAPKARGEKIRRKIKILNGLLAMMRFQPAMHNKIYVRKKNRQACRGEES
jgi:hypothetical protein